MPPWLSGVFGAVGGFASGFFGSGSGASTQPPAEAKKPVWPWVLGGVGLFVLLLVIVLSALGKTKAA